MNTFWALVRNEAKLEKGDCRQRSFLNSIYFGIANALLLGGFMWADLQGFINGGFILWCVVISIPFGTAISLLNKEWQEGTTGWWLTLPYSRSFLLAAKCVACFWRVLKYYAILFAITQLLMLIQILNLPDFIPHPQLLTVLLVSARDLAWLLILSPISILLGTLMVMITRSHWTSPDPLFWTGLGLLVNLFAAKALGLSPLSAPLVHLEQGYYISANGSDFSTIVFIVLAASTLLFAFSVYVLDHHIEG